MKVLLSWLREFAPDIEGDPVALGDKLTALGLTVEDVTITGGGLDGVVVARVLDLRPHPTADRIQLVDVDTGDGEALQVCCGAFNMAVGDLVPFATIGTIMPTAWRSVGASCGASGRTGCAARRPSSARAPMRTGS